MAYLKMLEVNRNVWKKYFPRPLAMAGAKPGPSPGRPQVASTEHPSKILEFKIIRCFIYHPLFVVPTLAARPIMRYMAKGVVCACLGCELATRCIDSWIIVLEHKVLSRAAGVPPTLMKYQQMTKFVKRKQNQRNLGSVHKKNTNKHKRKQLRTNDYNLTTVNLYACNNKGFPKIKNPKHDPNINTNTNMTNKSKTYFAEL